MIISVDFDDTITRSTNGLDIRKEMPEIRWEIVDHMRKLKEQGHYIKVVTARGCLSCNNDMNKRIAKYYDRIKQILDVNNIPYDELSFNKEYAEVYLDDSCGNAVYSDFEIYHNPNSKNHVVRYGDMIVKEGPTTGDEWDWYCRNRKFNVPDGIRFNPLQKILYMKYIKPTTCSIYSYSTVLRTAINCKPHPYEPKMLHMFETFVRDTLQRSKLEIKSEMYHALQDFYAEVVDTMATSFSFESHGDLTTANIIDDGNDVYVIDPVAPENQYRGPWLDLGKFRFSLDKYFFPKAPNITIESCLKETKYQITKEEMSCVRFCTILCYIRLSKYRSSPEDLAHIEERVWELLNEKDKPINPKKED